MPGEDLIKLGLGTMSLRLSWQKYIETDQDPGVGGEIQAITILRSVPVVMY